MTTYLNVPYNARAEAKAKGARWDSEARKWFVPIGRDLEPFTTWLPVDPAKLASREFADADKGVPLSQLLAGVAKAARNRAFQAVNTQLVGLYWQIGEYISGKLSAAEWGEGVVDRLAEHMGRTVAGVRGSRRRTCGACGSSSRRTGATQNSHRW